MSGGAIVDLQGHDRLHRFAGEIASEIGERRVTAAVQLIVVVIVLGIRTMFYRGATSGGKG